MKKLNHKPKLLIVTPYFHPKPGGLENYALNIARGLQKYHGWDVVVVTTNHTAKKSDIKKLNGINIYRLSLLWKISNTPLSPFWYFAIKNIIKQEKPDIINAHAPVPFIADVAASVSGTIPFILTYHAGTMKKEQLLYDLLIDAYERIFLPRLMKRANRIICSSKFVQNTSVKKFKTKSVVITPAVDTSLFKPGNKNKSDNTILFIGNNADMYKIKGLYKLIDAVTNMPNVILKVVGEKIPNDKKNYFSPFVILSKAKDLIGIFGFKIQNNMKYITHKNIKFLGIKKGKNLVKEIQKSTLLVLPSIAKTEGFGMVLIEAMACKTPVIGSNIGGIPEVITHKKDGFLVPVKNSLILKQALRKIINDKNLAKTLAENGYKKVQANYTWDKKIIQTNKALKAYL